jgi:hypothetical protein
MKIMENYIALLENNEKQRAGMIAILTKMYSEVKSINEVNAKLEFVLDEGSNEQIKEFIKQMFISTYNMMTSLTEMSKKARLLQDEHAN